MFPPTEKRKWGEIMRFVLVTKAKTLKEDLTKAWQKATQDGSKQDDIDVAWNEAEELHESLTTLYDEELIECKDSLIDRVNAIMNRLHRHASPERDFYYTGSYSDM